MSLNIAVKLNRKMTKGILVISHISLNLIENSNGRRKVKENQISIHQSERF
jgi:hypothetical protein